MELKVPTAHTSLAEIADIVYRSLLLGLLRAIFQASPQTGVAGTAGTLARTGRAGEGASVAGAVAGETGLAGAGAPVGGVAANAALAYIAAIIAHGTINSENIRTTRRDMRFVLSQKTGTDS